MNNSCRIDYIENLPNITDQEKKILTNKHLDISRRLYQHRTTNNQYSNKVFTFTGNSLYTLSSGVYYDAANKLISEINTNEGFEAVKLITDSKNPNRKFVNVDVSLAVGEEQEITDEGTLNSFNKKYFGVSDIVIGNDEFEEIVNKSQDYFTDISREVKEKVNVYLNSLKDANNKIPDNVRGIYNVYKNLAGALSDGSTYGIINGMHQYIFRAINGVDYISKNLNIIENRLNNLDEDAKIRAEQLATIANFTRYSSEYFHLFDKLESISGEFTRLNIQERAIDGYEKDKLESDLKEWLEDLAVFTDEEIIDFLNTVAAEIGNTGNLFTQFKQRWKDKLNGVIPSSDEVDVLEKQMLNIINKNAKSEGSTLHQLNNLINSLRPLKSKLADLHYDVLVETYYPTFVASFDQGKKGIYGEDLDAKWKLSKKDFKTLLKIGEEDIDAVTKWGGAMINIGETLPVSIANFFKELFFDVDINNKRDINDFQDFLSSNGRTQQDDVLKELDSNSYTQLATIETMEELDDSFIDDEFFTSVTLNVLGQTKKYKARKTLNFLNQHNTVSYHNNKKAFSHNIDGVIQDLSDKLMDNKYALTYLRDSGDEVLSTLYSMMYQYNIQQDTDVLTNSFGAFLNESPEQEDIKNRLSSMLWSSFYRNNISVQSEENINKLFIENNIIDSKGNFTDVNNISVQKYILKNSYFVNYKETNKGSNLQSRYIFDKQSLFGKGNNSSKQVLVKFTDETYGYVELLSTQNGAILSNTSGKEIAQYATFSGDFSTLHNKYNIEYGGFGDEGVKKWNKINEKTFNKEYFDRIIKLYQKARKNYGGEYLLNRELPQVDKMEESSALQRAKDAINNAKGKTVSENFMDYASTYFVEENKKPLMKNGELVDEDGNPVDTPVYVSTEYQYVNGQQKRYIEARFTRPISINKIETDLYKSLLLYNSAANRYRAVKNNESQFLLLQTVLEGDKTLGIDMRKAHVTKLGDKVKLPGGGFKMTDQVLRTSEMIVSTLNSYVYGIENEDFGILGSKISAKKIAGMINKYTAFTSLAWNVSTMPSNILISAANSRVVAESTEFYNAKHWNDAYATYRKNLPLFLKDLNTKGFNNQRSVISQLIVHFDAIQGDFLDPKGQIVSSSLGERLYASKLFWTQESAEHLNQTTSMIMLMMGYNITTPEGETISLWDAIQQENKGKKDGTSIKFPEYFTKEDEIKFRKRLHGVNRQIHGNFQTIDKNMMQRHVFMNMFMTFKKHIYDAARSRFMSIRYDQELRDEQEGYFRTYLKGLNKEFAEIAKSQGMTAALRSNGLTTIGKSLLKTTAGAWDAAFGRIISKNNKGVADFLYGEDLTTRQNYAAMRATYEMGWIVRTMIFALVAEALISGLDDDDEVTMFLLRYADVYSRRLESDMGVFTSFTNVSTFSFPGAATFDQFLKTVKSPLASVRTMDNTAGLFKQLVSVDFYDDEGDFDIQWGAFEQYEKGGNGYEKGDYKILRKAQKSVFAPYYQMIRLSSPEQMQKWLNLTTRYQN